MHFNFLPNVKVLDWPKFLKAFAFAFIYAAQMMIYFFDRVENIVGKRRKCWSPAFSPFPTIFSKGLSLKVV